MIKEKETLFQSTGIGPDKKKEYLDVDLNALYERAFAELGLQQTKRDQIITLYLAIFSFLIPFALSIEVLDWHVKGLIFLAAAIVGILFSFIIIRYRIYKEAYWLCCQSLTVLFGIRTESLNKETIQAVYYETLKKKGKSFLGKNGKFSKWKYVKKNLFSSESIYYFIHAFIAALIFALSVGLILPVALPLAILCGCLAGVLLLIWLGAAYFKECIKVYQVLIDGKESSFNSIFSKAWFLHFYV